MRLSSAMAVRPAALKIVRRHRPARPPLGEMPGKAEGGASAQAYQNLPPGSPPSGLPPISPARGEISSSPSSPLQAEGRKCGRPSAGQPAHAGAVVTRQSSRPPTALPSRRGWRLPASGRSPRGRPR
ncbi:hypothetical protein E3C22_03310 [Jiella endophytica]|uniref:Uncharacterized protein n=1 Tax=Jiella endophytica TaxID=2558362 RepID=A0A4Y8RT64_9HYPH|nr:hypothetical protein E3C22_03310 [Jiella endophytica]